MIDKSIDVKKIAEIEGIDLGDTSKLNLDELDNVSGGSDYADEIIKAFGSAFALMYAAGYIVQHGHCPVCNAEIQTSGDINDKEALDIAMEHLQTVHVKQ